MRFLVLVKGDENSEGGKLPPKGLVEEMGKFNDALSKAGVMLAADGLHPTSRGAKVRFEGKKRTVIDGPFTEAKEIVAGFWIWQCKSRAEAIEWLKRAPFGGGDVEIREIFEQEDFLKQLK